MVEKFMRVILDEHGTMLNSCQAQTYGGGEGLTREAAQG